ncbi:MAG TPA: serine/threonine-protein kinase [Polyangiaceae bacterium]
MQALLDGEGDGAGHKIGKFIITRRLGGGGMSVVYEAQHTDIGRRFAIKFLRPELARHRAILARFMREARAAGALESDHIAATVDFGEAPDGTPYIVMEYLQGEDLASLLARSGPLDASTATAIVVQACHGLAVAHARGVVHRDLKPENLFLCQRDDGGHQVKILDFGIAKLRSLDSDDSRADGTCPGEVIGTPAYMAPEQALGSQDVDQSVDVYALGAILYESLSGRRAHPGRSRSEILYHVITKPIDRLHDLRPDLPHGLADAVHRALEKDPKKRFACVGDLAANLTAQMTSRSSGSGDCVASSVGSQSADSDRWNAVVVAVAQLALAAFTVTNWILRGRPSIARFDLETLVNPCTSVEATPEPIVPSRVQASSGEHARREAQDSSSQPTLAGSRSISPAEPTGTPLPTANVG